MNCAATFRSGHASPRGHYEHMPIILQGKKLRTRQATGGCLPDEPKKARFQGRAFFCKYSETGRRFFLVEPSDCRVVFHPGNHLVVIVQHSIEPALFPR